MIRLEQLVKKFGDRLAVDRLDLHIAAGETATARLTLAVRDLAYFDPQARAWIAEAGDYELVIAANANVVKDVAPYEMVGGNPARHIKFRFDEGLRQALLTLRWWELTVREIRLMI